MAADYFSSEGGTFLLRLRSPVKKDLTVRHLEKAIKAGKLDEEVINS